jgi:type II secretory pathway component HofQ
MARGKLASDLGRHAEAAALFRSVAESEDAPQSQRWEARVRLGTSLREAGDPAGSSRAFEQAWHGRPHDPEDIRFLIEALGSPTPGGERWEEVWSQVDVEFGEVGGPAPRVVWPGVPADLCPRAGHAISLDFEDGNLQDIFRLFADITGFNVVVAPSTSGLATAQFEKRPWDQALCEILAPHGYVAQHVGNVLWIGRPEHASPRTTFSGRPIDVDFHDVDLIEALSRVAAEGGARVEAAPGIGGRVTIVLREVPWDQVFDVIVNVNGLTWTREGEVLSVAIR